MRYFISLPLSKAFLSLCVIQATLSTFGVFLRRSFAGSLTGLNTTTGQAITLPPVTPATDHHGCITTQTIKQTGILTHSH